MIEVLFYLGPIPVLSSGFTWMFGVVVVYFTGIHLAKIRSISKSEWRLYLVLLVVFGLLGARLGHVLTEWSYYKNHLDELLNIHEGGMTYYYGLLLAFCIGSTYGWFKGRALDYIDLGLVNTCLAHAFGRFGCFLYGCCYGSICPKDSFWYPFSHSVIGLEGIRYPIQLLSAIGLLILYFALRQVYLHSRSSGVTSLMYLSSYAVLRFVFEFFRDDPRGRLPFPILDQFSTSQGIAICFLIVLIPVNLYTLYRKTRKF